MKNKVNDLVRLHKTMQEKLKTASYSEERWYLINSLECVIQNILISLNALFKLHTATLKELLDQELRKHEDDRKISYCHWNT